MEYNQFTLKQAAAYDKAKGLANQITGWGLICMQRAEMKTNRKYKPGYKKYQAKKVATW
jgi:hypothetical protein